MWKARPDEKPLNSTSFQPSASSSSSPAGSTGTLPVTSKDTVKHTGDSLRSDVGHIGKSVMIRGELSGSEDLYLDGQVEGSIDLRDHTLIIGPNGRIKANINAREVILHGKVDGNVHATERVEMKKACSLVGDVSTQRIVIEDGAFFKGAIEIQKEAKSEPPRKPVAAATSSPALTNGGATGTQASFLEAK